MFSKEYAQAQEYASTVTGAWADWSRFENGEEVRLFVRAESNSEASDKLHGFGEVRYDAYADAYYVVVA